MGSNFRMALGSLSTRIFIQLCLYFYSRYTTHSALHNPKIWCGDILSHNDSLTLSVCTLLVTQLFYLIFSENGYTLLLLLVEWLFPPLQLIGSMSSSSLEWLYILLIDEWPCTPL